MIFTATRLEDAYLIDVERHAHERGLLARTCWEREHLHTETIRAFKWPPPKRLISEPDRAWPDLDG